MHPFPYGRKEIAHLSAADPRMAALIARCEREGIRPERPVDENAFNCLIRAINDQLISLKAAATIWSRITALAGDPVQPARMATLRPEDIAACGTTRKKAEYMHGIACSVVEGSLDLEALRHAPDDEVVRTLVSLRGIGRWTAEMLLIHCYERPDVISYGDAAIRRGLCMLHEIDPQTLDDVLFSQLTAPYRPYSTTASIYLWWLSKQ